MTPETLQFQCGYCSTTLTVPAQMAGVSGPCPNCGQTVTSPAAQPVAAALFTASPQWPPAPPAPAPAMPTPGSMPEPPAWLPPGMQPPAAAAGGMGGGSPPSPAFDSPSGHPAALAGGLPPRRAPGQSPLAASSSSLPSGGSGGGSPAWGSTPAAPGLGGPLPQGGAGGLNHSRLIPGSPALPNALGGGGGLGQQAGIPGSLLGRDVSPAPISPPTQALQQPVPLSSLNLGGPTLGGPLPAPGSATPHAPAPASRKMADLREPRGASFLRLAFAAVFLLGFLGIVGFFLKDYLPPGLLRFLHRDDAEETSTVADGSHGTPVPTLPSPPVLPRPNEEKAKSATPKADPQIAAFDPAETAPSKTEAATPPPPSLTGTTPAPPEAAPAPGAEPPAGSATKTLSETEKAVGVASNVGTASTAMTPPPMSMPPAGDTEDEGAIPEAAKPAVEALKRFLAAPTVEARLRYTLGADMMQPLMERYYARSPEGPISVDRVQFIRLDPNPELGSGRHCILSLENKSWEFPVPVMLEEQAEGFKVDWLAFVEFKDRLLEKFFQNYQEGPTPFHVGIMRHHYFDDGVPNVDRKDAFRIGPAPPNTFQAYAFLDKDSPLAAELKTRLPWEHHVWAIVYLEWKKLGSHQWVELAGVPQMHWYSLPLGSKAPSNGGGSETRSAKTSLKPSASQEMPPGISKNGVGNATSSSLPPPGISKNGVGSAGKNNPPPPGIRKSTPLPDTIRRPMPMGR